MTPRTVACQALLSMGFSRQEYWSGSSFPSPGDLHNPGIKPLSRALAGRFFTTEPPGKPSQFPGTATKLWILTSWPFPFWWSGLLHLFLSVIWVPMHVYICVCSSWGSWGWLWTSSKKGAGMGQVVPKELAVHTFSSRADLWSQDISTCDPGITCTTIPWDACKNADSWTPTSEL